MIFTAYGKKCRLILNEVFTDTFSLRAGWHNGTDWIYIHGETLGDISTKEKCDAEFKRCLAVINKDMAELWSKDKPEPKSGINRIQWLIDNSVYVENNELKVK